MLNCMSTECHYYCQCNNPNVLWTCPCSWLETLYSNLSTVVYVPQTWSNSYFQLEIIHSIMQSHLISLSFSVCLETDRERGTQTSPLSALWQSLHDIKTFKDSSESSYRRETSKLWPVWESFQYSQSSKSPPTYSHWREAVLVWEMWENFLSR